MVGAEDAYRAREILKAFSPLEASPRVLTTIIYCIIFLIFMVWLDEIPLNAQVK
jgi:hypothetical protein